MRASLLVFLLSLMALAYGSTAVTSPSFLFATLEQARTALTVRDDFVQRLSPFDRAARLKTDADVSERQYLDFVSSNVLPWEEGPNKKRVAQALTFVAARLSDLSISLPKDILVIRTTGREEGGAPYTRGHSIVLPDSVLADPNQDLVKVVSHETFHILSRNSDVLRANAYRVIGFTLCPDFRFPPDLADRRITNPDAPRNDHWIEVQYRGTSVRAIPILYARTPKYDPTKGGEFFDYLQFRLALISPGVGPESEARFVDVREVQGFFEQVGRNTDYIIHPEEILADNFALLFVKSSPVPTPAIPAAVLKAVQTVSRAQPAVPADGLAPLDRR
jgi:hypothetical protein